MTHEHRRSGTPPSTLFQLCGRRSRLERELSSAFSVQPLRSALIKRLIGDLTATESAISDMKVTYA